LSSAETCSDTYELFKRALSSLGNEAVDLAGSGELVGHKSQCQVAIFVKNPSKKTLEFVPKDGKVSQKFSQISS